MVLKLFRNLRERHAERSRGISPASLDGSAEAGEMPRLRSARRADGVGDFLNGFHS